MGSLLEREACRHCTMTTFGKRATHEAAVLDIAAGGAPRDRIGAATRSGTDISAYARFMVYPHLQKGWESMQRGERDRALAEFERARSLAPDNAAVALYLAAAYRQFGEPQRAESLLLHQLTRTPHDARVVTALADLRASAPAAAAVIHDNACAEVVSAPCPELPPLTAPRSADRPRRPRPSAVRRRTRGSPRRPVRRRWRRHDNFPLKSRSLTPAWSSGQASLRHCRPIASMTRSDKPTFCSHTATAARLCSTV